MPPNSATALANYQTAQSSQQSPDQILSSTEQSLGVPGAQQQVSGLRQAITNTTNLLNGVAPSIYGRTQNSLVTNSQANRQIQNESAPIQATLGKQNTDYGNQESDLQSLLGRAGSLASLKAQGQSNNLTALKSIYDAVYGQEQDQAKAQQAADALAEQKRQFDVSSSKTGGSLSDTKYNNEQNAQAQLKGDISSVSSDLKSLSGSDGYVSPQTYSSAAKNWVAAGYNIKDFNNYFAQYKNPQNPYYAI